MIQNDVELQAAQEYVLRFERILAAARRRIPQKPTKRWLAVTWRTLSVSTQRFLNI